MCPILLSKSQKIDSRTKNANGKNVGTKNIIKKKEIKVETHVKMGTKNIFNIIKKLSI
jgi:hypothetical protein